MYCMIPYTQLQARRFPMTCFYVSDRGFLTCVQVSLDFYRRESAKIIAIFKECIPDGEVGELSCVAHYSLPSLTCHVITIIYWNTKPIHTTSQKRPRLTRHLLTLHVPSGQNSLRATPILVKCQPMHRMVLTQFYRLPLRYPGRTLGF
jgi:hypothetical protein